MLEFFGLALAGTIVFLIGLARLSPIRAGDRTAEIVLAIFSALTLAAALVNALDTSAPSGDKLAAAGRMFALCVGAVCGYLVYRLYRRRVPPQPERSRLRPGPRLPPGYEAASRRMGQLLEAARADRTRGTLSEEKKQAYLKALEENKALLDLHRRSLPPLPDPASLPPEYVALSREADQTFQAMKDAAARGIQPSPQDALKLESYAMRMAEQDEAMFQKTQRQWQMTQRAGYVLAALALLYLVIQFLAV
jgi:hypothetical protein